MYFVDRLPVKVGGSTVTTYSPQGPTAQLTSGILIGVHPKARTSEK